MMEILCSETNRMDKNCPAPFILGAARTCVRGKRMAVRRRKVGGSVEVEFEFESYIARASGIADQLISFNQLFVPLISPKKAKRS